VFLTCHRTHVNFICELYEISYKPVCKKFLSNWLALPSRFLCKQKRKKKNTRLRASPSITIHKPLSLSLSDQRLSTCVTVLPQVALPKLFCAQRSSRSLPRLPPWPSTNIYIFFNLINYFFQENWGALTPPPLRCC